MQEMKAMDARIPDFGRASVDQLDKVVTDFFKKNKEKRKDDPVLFSCDRIDLSSLKDPGSEKKKWTVLLYMDGNNNLFGPMYDAMKGLEGVGSNDDVNLVVELGGNPGNKPHSGGLLETVMGAAMKDKKIETVRRYYVTKDFSESDKIKSPVLQDLGIQDMGDPKVISDFLEWGIKKFPAENYAIVFFDHGAGFAGSMSDESTGHLMNTNQLKEVIDNAAAAAGKKIDLVNFDACLMAQVEVAHAMKDGASYMVASEETERGSAQPLPKVIKDLQAGSTDKPMDPADLARLFVYESFHQNQSEILTATLSAVDLSKIDDLVESTDRLSQVLMSGAVDPAKIRKNAEKAEHYCQGLNYKLYNDYRDLGHFAQLMASDAGITDEAARKAAQDVVDAVKNAVIAFEHQGKAYQNSSGISTYLPTNFGFDPQPKTDSVNFSSTHNYEGIPYSKDTQWDEMVKYIARDTTWHTTLKSMGMSREGIEALDAKLHRVGSIAMGISKAILGMGKWGARYEAFQGIRHGMPKSYMWLGSELSTKLGALGGGYKVFEGVKGMFDACQDKPPEGITDILLTKKNKMVNAGLNMAEGTAMVAVNTALMLGASSGITTAAGLLTFALPVAKVIYDGLSIPGNLKAKAEEAQKPNPVDNMYVEQKLQDIEKNHGHFVK